MSCLRCAKPWMATYHLSHCVSRFRILYNGRGWRCNIFPNDEIRINIRRRDFDGPGQAQSIFLAAELNSQNKVISPSILIFKNINVLSTEIISHIPKILYAGSWWCDYCNFWDGDVGAFFMEIAHAQNNNLHHRIHGSKIPSLLEIKIVLWSNLRLEIDVFAKVAS